MDQSGVGTPFVLGYHTSPIFYLLARRLITIQHIGLVNLVAGRTVVPEHVGWRSLDVGLAADLHRLWTDAAFRDEQRRGLAEVRAKLEVHGAYVRAAEEIAGFVAGARPPSQYPITA